MRKFQCLLMFISIIFSAKAQTEAATEHSSTGYIIFGAILLVAIIIILYRRQKRKFND